jgi:hypothetical protein
MRLDGERLEMTKNQKKASSEAIGWERSETIKKPKENIFG